MSIRLKLDKIRYRNRFFGLIVLFLLVPTIWIVYKPAYWPIVLTIVPAAILAAMLLRSIEQRRMSTQMERMLHHAHLSAMRTLSHQRHDWMNDLQILYGYIRLNKVDKANEVIGRIREKMELDSKISNLGLPELSMYILALRSNCDTLRLEIDVQEGWNLALSAYNSNRLVEALIKLINVFRFRSVTGDSETNWLRLHFSQRNGQIEIQVQYDGMYVAAAGLEEDLAASLNGIGVITSEQAQVHELPSTDEARSMVIHFPLPA